MMRKTILIRPLGALISTTLYHKLYDNNVVVLQQPQHYHKYLQQQQQLQQLQEKQKQHLTKKISKEELSKHDGNNNSRIWVSYKRNVYDITDFVDHHPGSKSKIMMAAGGPIDPYWKFWVIHLDKGPEKNIGLNVLEKYYIGELKDDEEDDDDDESIYIENLENKNDIDFHHRDYLGEFLDNKKKDKNKEEDEDDEIWNNEPSSYKRSKLIPMGEPGGSLQPFQAESPLQGDKFITPNDEFYIRNHAPTPEKCTPTVTIEIELPRTSSSSSTNEEEEEEEEEIILPKHMKPFRPVSFSKETLKILPTVRNLAVTLQCSGNRLGETWKALNKNNLYNRFGVNAWSGHGLISNATWSGVKLCDIFKEAGITKELLFEYDKHINKKINSKQQLIATSSSLTTNSKNYTHNIDDEEDEEDEDKIWWVEMYGSEGYSNAIPLSMVLDPRRDVLIAYEMNGEKLSRDHGNPLRAIVPGAAAAKSVKWLNRIVIKKKNTCESPWFNTIYRDPPSHNNQHIAEWPVQSFIQSQHHCNKNNEESTSLSSSSCIEPTNETSEKSSSPYSQSFASTLLNYDDEVDNEVVVTGFAYSGGGRSIKKVEISLDNGITWPLKADLTNMKNLKEKEKIEIKSSIVTNNNIQSSSSSSSSQQNDDTCNQNKNKMMKKEANNNKIEYHHNVKYNWTWTKWSIKLSQEQQNEILNHHNSIMNMKTINNIPTKLQKKNLKGPFICCRATDSSGDTQPNTRDEAVLKHPSGYFFNPIHRVKYDPTTPSSLVAQNEENKEQFNKRVIYK